MTKKDYEKIALVFQETCPLPVADTLEHKAQWDFDRNQMADMLARDSGRFDRARFIRACEPGANVRART